MCLVTAVSSEWFDTEQRHPGVLPLPDGLYGYCCHNPHRFHGGTLEILGFVLMGLWVSMFIYPLVGNWVWGGGWLANLGRSIGWGNGAVDFAGSGVVHMIGGAVGLAGAMVIGPRIGNSIKMDLPIPFPVTALLWAFWVPSFFFFGWFGFNPGSSPRFTGGFRNLAILAAVNTLLAGAAGGMSAMLYMWWFSKAKKPDAGMSVNGVLAGLVAITAPCAFVDIWAGRGNRFDRRCLGMCRFCPPGKTEN